MANSVIEDYVKEAPPKPPKEDDDDIEVKRESLAILATLGTAKDFIGVDMTLGDVKRLSEKNTTSDIKLSWENVSQVI